jgi:phosphoglycolate phosphatase
MNYKHIIWDYNGTLLNDVSLCVEVINGMLSQRNLETVSVQKYRELFDFPVKDYYEKAGFDFEKESFENVGTEFIVEYDKHQNKTELHSGTLELLEEIKAAGISQSILSARKEEQLIKELKQLNVFDFFEEVVGLNDHYAGGKIERGIYLMTKLNLANHELLLIGDTKHDAEVAKTIGIDCVLISHGHHTSEKLQSCGFEIFENIDSLYQYILKK